MKAVELRMAETGITEISAYMEYIRGRHHEIDKLFETILSITMSFREGRWLTAVRKKILPAVLDVRDRTDPLRIWVPLCGTGEDAFSIAMIVHESAPKTRIKIFATDIHEPIIVRARKGRFSRSALESASSRRVRQFFRADSPGENPEEYVVHPDIRASILFSQNDLLLDPPFAKIDLIYAPLVLSSCEQKHHDAIIEHFRRALAGNGHILLGSQELPGRFAGCFSQVDLSAGIYRAAEKLPRLPRESANSTKGPNDSEERMLLRTLIAHLGAAMIRIDSEYRITPLQGPINKFLKGPDPDLFKLFAEPAGVTLVATVRKALRRGKIAEADLALDAASERIARITVIPENRHAPANDVQSGSAVVLFREHSSQDRSSADAQVTMLRKENARLKDELDRTIRDLSLSNEELSRTYEELQSRHEKLETLTEELKATNEELASSLAELSEAHSDLRNILTISHVGIMFIGQNLTIRRFTSAMSDFFPHISIGRPVSEITAGDHQSLLPEIESVLRSGTPVEREVCGSGGRWFLLRFDPYRAADAKAIGVVGTLLDVTDARADRVANSAALLEKEALLAEVNHRVKNNLQIVSSVLRLRSSAIRDKRATAAFRDLQAMIASMGLVHEKLYQSDGLSRIDFREYLDGLATGIQRFLKTPRPGIRVTIEAENIFIGIEKAVPCGIVLNELMTNSFKHAFPRRRWGRISVTMRRAANRIEIEVSDDGIGMTPIPDLRQVKSLGMILVTTLVHNQLGGAIKIESSKGTRIRIAFPDGNKETNS